MSKCDFNADLEVSLSDIIKKPNHYIGDNGIEVESVIDGFAGELKGLQAFRFGNIVKYILRFQKKNGLQDLKKAQENLKRFIEAYERSEKDDYVVMGADRVLYQGSKEV